MYQIVMAHPDDEVIFGWPILKEADSILMCSSDANNPNRVWCKDRNKALREVCEALEVEFECLNYNSEFYRLSTRDEKLKRMMYEIQNRCSKDIYTHNPWGEYGNIDHILIYQIVSSCDANVFYCDILIESNWLPVRRHSLGIKHKKAEWDERLYNKLKDIYIKYGCWTWNKEPVREAFIYESYNGSR